MQVKVKRRNVVLMFGPFVIKFARGRNVSRTFREFLFGWRAFLHGLAPPQILLGPFLVRLKVTLLKDVDVKDVWRDVLDAVKRLNALGIEHRELRHPERHVGFWRGRVVFIDFERARVRKRPRDVNKFLAWLKSKGVYSIRGQKGEHSQGAKIGQEARAEARREVR